MSDEIVTLSGGEAQSVSLSITAGAQSAVANDADLMHRNAGPAPASAGGGASLLSDHLSLGAESAGDPPLGGVARGR